MNGNVCVRFYTLLPAHIPVRSAEIPSNSLVEKNLRITPTPARIYEQIPRNSMKTRNFGEGGGGYPKPDQFPNWNSTRLATIHRPQATASRATLAGHPYSPQEPLCVNH